MKPYTPTARTRIRRLPKRARYDRETVYAILDAGFVCHLGYVIDGQPYVTPTACWREGDVVYWHGSSTSKMLLAFEKSPRRTDSRYSAFASLWLMRRSSSSDAISRGTTTTPAWSATTRSPGLTTMPPQQIG